MSSSESKSELLARPRVPTTSRVSASDAPELVRFFERAGSGCFCRYWHFSGDKNAWLDRLANAPERNAAELSESLTEGNSELLGVVARNPGEPSIVGWLKLTRAQRVPKLYEQRVYRGLPCFGGDRSGIFAIGCFLVDPAERRRGVARGLLGEGIELAERLGGTAIEAFPRRAELLGNEERWTGPFELFIERGFEVVHDFAQYPVLRRTLG